MTKTMNEAETEVRSIDTYFKWIIPNINLPKTFIKLEENIVYKLRFLPYNKEKTHTCLLLKIKSSDKLDVSARFNIPEINGLGVFSFNKLKENKILYWGWNKFVARKNISSLKRDTLTIECYLNFKPLSTNNDYNSYKFNKQMLTNLNNLLSSGNFSDVTLKTRDGTEFPVHKCILSVQSSVFLAMFQHDMLENLNNIVTIDDVESNVLKALLEFIYSNKFDKTSLILDKLLIASDKYDIKDLKTFCEIELCNTLTVDNAVDYLKLSDLHESKLLKSHALEFIAGNLTEMLKKNSFKNLEIKQPSLLIEILQLKILELDKTNPILDKLFIASDKYDIKNLKSLCEEELSNTLTVDNAIDYLKLSDMHDSQLLKKHALNYIAENVGEMLKKNSFITLEIERPRLITDILQSVHNKKST